ncbi:molecular chaperone DnaJ [Vitiosangium sp. GDMCC 1.1324]|uniref:molecular chaperone DnaJ n=1 Tax=Vitiosangium sp. (strain GDMCC 1.1324) TaxID=2138576 RepID=UPI000D39D525|nr:molecular chaperone DnaJ [Vitiosangium sp. GDMCC 1.1324]PTL83745.1 molecular chaperone DnaJ [Vitiosangium sp. GDMCC 1.1324]
MAKGGQTPKDPASPRMQAAWKLKESGDVVAARLAAERLLADSPSPEDRVQAEELLRRSTTPVALYGFAALAAFILVLLVVLAATRY